MNNLTSIIHYKYLMQKSNLVVILALVATAAFMMYSAQESQSTEPIFEEWKEKHGLMLDLSAQEQVYRLKIFERNLQVINEHNSKPNQSYKMGINKFTAYTLEEFENSFLTKIEPNPAGSVVESPAENLNLSVDWVSYGAVSPVKSQGTCVASYAFSAVGAIEGISVIFYKTQTEYSVQQIIDCSTSYGNQGCSTGNMINSFNYVKDKGIQSQSAYPYTGRFGSCMASSGLFKIKGSYAISSGACSTLESALLTRPISVAVDGQNFASYSSGIFDNCGRSLSLATLLVGATDTFYKLKLSWGTSWGEGGYIRLHRTGVNSDICGICQAASYPLQ